MNADAFRHFYEYHFAQNRKVWDAHITPLSPERFTQDVKYSHGSVRDQVVHLMSVDDMWFSQLRGADFPEPLPVDIVDRGLIRAHWDDVERRMRDYLERCGTTCCWRDPSRKERTRISSCGRCFSTSPITAPTIAHSCCGY